MKKYLVFIVIAMAIMSLTVTGYYFLRPTEAVFAENTSYQVNVGESFDVVYTLENPRIGTEVFVESLHPEIVSFRPTDGKFIANKGGAAIISITTNDADFEGIIIDVRVGDGSYTTPYYVEDMEFLSKIGVDPKFSLDKNYILSDNIDYSETITAEGEEEFNFIGVGSITDPFTGSLDGNGHSIRNLEVNGSGLFNKLGATAIVKNLTLENSVINSVSAASTGAIAGVSEGRIENVSVINTKVEGAGTYTGGVVGELVSTVKFGAIVENTVFTGGVIGTSYTGGVAGLLNGGTIANSVVKSGIDYSALRSKTDAAGVAYIGGLAGRAREATATEATDWDAIILDSYVDILIYDYDVNTATKAGIVAELIETDTDKQVLHGAYYLETSLVGESSAEAKAIGGASDSAPTNERNVAGYESSFEFLAAGMNLASYYNDEGDVAKNWDFINTWEMTRSDDENFGGLPRPRVEAGRIEILTILTDILEDGGIDNHTIGNAETFISSFENGGEGVTYTIIKDIDFGGASLDSFPAFNGRLVSATDNETGEFYVVKNLTINGPGLFEEILASSILEGLVFENIKINSDVASSDDTGLAGTLAAINNGVIRNVEIKGTQGYVYSSLAYSQIGGVVAVNSNKIENVTVTDIAVKSSIVASSGTAIEDTFLEIGGVAGLNSGTIDGARVNAAIGQKDEGLRMNVGGVAGTNRGYIKNSIVSGDVLGAENLQESWLDNPLNQSQDSNKYYVKVGGIVGVNYNAGIRDAYQSGQDKFSWVQNMLEDAEVESCKVENANITGAYVAGLVAINYGDVLASLVKESTITGHNVGGLVTANFVYEDKLGGNLMASTAIDNNLIGISSSSDKAGIIVMSRGYSVNVKFGEGTYVVGNVAANSFSGEGDSFRETRAIVADEFDEGGLGYDSYFVLNFSDKEVDTSAKSTKTTFLFIQVSIGGYTTAEMVDENFWTENYENNSSGIGRKYMDFTTGYAVPKTANELAW